MGAWLAGAGKASASPRRQRLQRGLVVAQIAVSVVLLTGAGLLTRTMLRLSRVDVGLDAGEEVLTMEVPIDFDGRNPADQAAMYDRAQAVLASLPGVVEVGVGSVMPLRNSGFQLEVKAEGRALAAGEPMPRADYRTASPEYFHAAGIPVLKGRAFESTDRGSGRVVILNQTLAERLFPGQDPIGRRVAWTGDVLRFIPVSGEWRTVVGVVGDTRDDGPDAGHRPVMFLPFGQEAVFAGGLVIRARQDASGMMPAATRVIHDIAPDRPIENVLTVSQIRDEGVAPRRLNAVLVTAFGALAVIIAAVGIAGVLAFSVSARTNEIGIRMSLGADSGQVQRMIISEGAVLLVAGLLLGVAGSLVTTRLIQGLLFGVAPHDPFTLAAVTGVMLSIGLFACWIPALRAARIDPGIAIRAQ